MPPCDDTLPLVQSSVLTSRRGLARLWSGTPFQKGLLVAAALSFGYGLISGYVDVQDRAERELALRLGPPAAIAVQNLDPGEDMGRAGELVLHAEIDLASSVVLQRDDETQLKSTMVIPILPVSDTGMALLADTVGGGDAVLGEQALRSATGILRPKAEGFLVIPLDRASESGLDKHYFAQEVHGAGRFGTVLTVTGEAHRRLIIDPEIKNVFAAINLSLADRPIALYPYLDGREAALSAARPVQHNQFFFVAAGCLAALCLALHGLRAVQGYVAPNLGFMARSAIDDEPETAPHPKFSRIPSQSEIQAAERRLAEERARKDGQVSFLGRLLGPRPH